MNTAMSYRNTACLALVLVATGPLTAQVTPDQMAEMTLNSARQAYNEKNYSFAATRFREFLAKFGGHKLANDARYGLALALLDAPEKNYPEAEGLLRGLAGNKDFAEQPLALYHLGVALRAQGMQELMIADAKPGEAPQRRNNAKQRFEQAAQQFTQALQTLTQRAASKKDRAGEGLSPEQEWVARARCDLAEMLLRVEKAKEARAVAEPLLAEPLWSRSKYRDLGRYYFSFASFLLGDHASAEKTLALLAPFEQPDFGGHARYLLARTHHLADERVEATHHYEGILQSYAKAKDEAAKMLQQPQTFKNDPDVRVRLEALTKNAPPDHVARATFYLAVLQYETGRFAEAKLKFAEFPKVYPLSPLRNDAELRYGFCQVQLKEFADAQKTLQPLIDRDKALSDQVLLWLAKAQAGAAPDQTMNAAGYQQALSTAVGTLRQAHERAQRLGDQDPGNRARRGEILLEIADLQQHLKQHREAANVCNQIINEKLLPEREEEVSLRLAQALHLAGDHNESDKACQRFLEKFKQSTLTPAVLFTMAENSYFRVLQTEKTPPSPDRDKAVSALYEETIKRCQAVVDKYPEYPKVHLARYTLGLTHYRKGDLASAQKTFEAIPATERGGELAHVPYLIADCVIRATPATVPEDALAAGQMEQQLKTSAELLDAFLSANPKDPQAPDALLKLGLCQQRQANLLAEPAEKQKALAVARATYERLMNEHAKHALAANAIFERGKVIAQAGDVNGGVNELRRFTADPLRQASAAPAALLQLATLLRGQNKAAEAAEALRLGREFHEPRLQNDPQQAGLIPLLRYHHGVALREAGKLPEARAAFDLVIKQAAGRPEAGEAALRLGQTLKEQGERHLDLGRKLMAAAKKPEEKAVAQKSFDDGFRDVREAVAFFENHAELLKKSDALPDVRARMLYEAAWGTRILAEPEIEAARTGIAKEIVKKLGAGAEKFPPPEVPIDKVPLQPLEKKARGIYQTLLEVHAESPVAVEARFELAELLAQRNEHDEALKLLGEVLDKEPAQELTEKVRLRLGAIHAAKGNVKGALAQFDVVASNPKSPLAGWAHYRAGETLLAEQQFPEAVKRLAIFRDNGQFQNIAGLSDRAMLRLGDAAARMQQWDQSRQAYERVFNAFPNSPWADEARYGAAWAWQQQKNHDAAVNLYAQITGRTATELAAKAQLQIGMCRAEQKRWVDAVNALLIVPTTYDYPELSAAARLEAAKAYGELKQREPALRELSRLERDFAGTVWAEAAKELRTKLP
jgi:cellulose synthase operon protein C